MKSYVVKSRRLRIYLQEKGLDCKVRKDNANPTKDIYLFDDSEIFRDLITEYSNNLKNQYK